MKHVIIVGAGPRILSSFSEKQSSRATRDLEKLGVQVWTTSMVTQITPNGIEAGEEKIESSTVLWAAGITAPPVNQNLEIPKDGQGRIIVEKDMSLRAFPNVFVCGDQASFSHQTGTPLPCLSPVAIQQGQCIAENIIREIAGKKRQPFHYRDKGQLATIGKSRAIADMDRLRFEGFFAWLVWIFVHIYFITGFNNRFFIFCRWLSSYMTNRKGARIILNNWWKFFDDK
jgi:NADH dehydrogenase